ncbi:MAG TPA: GNAT family N-acetyltransferase [Solirubrobacteraceae bacterium]|nr:GNAT family N-acetyltransferase [Solirubrobacteraceae bacterium]
MPFELDDGARVVIRPIEPGDKDRLVAGLQQLSEASIRKRFLAAKPRFSRSELRYLTEVDGVNHLALVAVLEDDPDQLVAVARCVRLPDRPGTAEMAIVVGDPWQGQGLGRELARRLADTALAVGIRRFAATMLGDNEAARRLMRTFSRRLEEGRVSGGVREVLVELAA